MQHFNFEYPYLLLFLFAFIAVDIFFKPKEHSFYIPNILTHIAPLKQKNLLKYIIKYTILSTFLLSLASPIFTKEIVDKQNHALDIVLSLDTSGSMSLNGFNELDYNQSRWSVVSDVASDFIKRRSKDRIGLVIFGDKSAIASPLSYDINTSLDTINKIDIGLVGKSTALIDSLVSASSLLKNSLSSSKLIILLSDGDDTASKISPEIALKLLAKYHIKVYTIAIGESNNNLLELIASKSHAKSYVANNKKDLSSIYKEISSLEADTHMFSKKRVVEHLYTYPLLVSLLFLLLFLHMQRKSEKI